MKIFTKQLLVLALGAALSMQARATDWYATDFGAKPDGKTLNTRILQAAIDHVSAQGGGRLVLSGGDFVSGSIWLKRAEPKPETAG